MSICINQKWNFIQNSLVKDLCRNENTNTLCREKDCSKFHKKSFNSLQIFRNISLNKCNCQFTNLKKNKN